MTDSQVIQRAPDIVSQNLSEEEGAVLLHLGTGLYHTLNPVGARIWELLESPCTEADLERKLLDEFASDLETLAGDIRRFVRELTERKLIERSPAR